MLKPDLMAQAATRAACGITVPIGGSLAVLVDGQVLASGSHYVNTIPVDPPNFFAPIVRGIRPRNMTARGPKYAAQNEM